METAADRLLHLGLDLHDGPLQDVAYLLGRVRALHDEIAAGEPRAALLARVDELEPALVELDDGLRSLVASLEHARAPQLELPAVVARFVQRSGRDVQLVVEDVAVPAAVADALAWVAQEALENVRRHSGARHVELRLRAAPRGCVLEVHDDGRGFDPGGASDRLGLEGMRRRMAACGGTLVVDSSPGGGTTICARYENDAAAVPFPRDPRGEGTGC